MIIVADVKPLRKFHVLLLLPWLRPQNSFPPFPFTKYNLWLDTSVESSPLFSSQKIQITPYAIPWHVGPSSGRIMRKFFNTCFCPILPHFRGIVGHV